MNWSNSIGADAPAAIRESMAALSFVLVDAMLIILWWCGDVALLQGFLVCLGLASFEVEVGQVCGYTDKKTANHRNLVPVEVVQPLQNAASTNKTARHAIRDCGCDFVRHISDHLFLLAYWRELCVMGQALGTI
jgi:hypothetical protein